MFKFIIIILFGFATSVVAQKNNKDKKDEDLVKEGDRIFIVANIRGERINGVYKVHEGSIYLPKPLGVFKLKGKNISDIQQNIWNFVTDNKTKYFNINSSISLMVGKYKPIKRK